MKVLLDENLPQQMRLELSGHDIFTAAYMKWDGIENGELLRRAAAAGLNVLITNDRGLQYQQNLGTLPVGVIVILAKANTIEAIRPAYAQIHSALARIQSGEFVKIVSP